MPPSSDGPAGQGLGAEWWGRPEGEEKHPQPQRGRKEPVVVVVVGVGVGVGVGQACGHHLAWVVVVVMVACCQQQEGLCRTLSAVGAEVAAWRRVV